VTSSESVHSSFINTKASYEATEEILLKIIANLSSFSSSSTYTFELQFISCVSLFASVRPKLTYEIVFKSQS
jgi:hypothetical protein